MAKPFELDETWLSRIASSVNGLEYGSVQIIVHDGRIVQIERTERKRFDPAHQAEHFADRPGKHTKANKG